MSVLVNPFVVAAASLPFGSPVHHYDFSDPANYTLNGSSEVTLASDLGSGGADLGSAAGKYPTIGTINGVDAASFDGTDDILKTTTGLDNSLDAGNDITIAIAFQLDVTGLAAATTYGLVKMARWGSTDPYLGLLVQGAADGWGFRVRDQAAATAEVYTSGQDTATHVMQVVVRPDNTADLYLDGVKVVDNLDTTTASSRTVDRHLSLGGLSSFTTSEAWPLDGRIGEVLIFDSALSAGDVAALNTYLQDKWMGEITFGDATYDRLLDGSNPILDIPDVETSGISGGTYELHIATRLAANPILSKADIENGTGDAIESFTLGPEADILDLDSAGLDLNTSLTGDAIDFFYEHSGGTTSDVGTEPGVTYDAVAPAFSSAVVENAAPSDVVITIDKANYDPSAVIAPGDFPLTGFTVSTAVVTNPTTITLGLSAAVVDTDVLTGVLSYTGTYLVGVDGEVLPTFANQDVTNNVAAGGVLDGFNRASENLEADANWSAVADHTAGTAQIVSNELEFSGSFTWTNAEHQDARTDDQWSELEYVSDTYSSGFISVGPAVRMGLHGGGGANGYVLFYDPAASELQIRRYTDGVSNTRATITSVTLTGGEVIRLDVVGTTLTAKIDGVPQTPTGSDSSHTSGNAGIRGICNTETITFDNFDAGDL